MAVLALLAVVLAVAAAAGAPYLFQVATLQTEIATQLRATTGLVLSAGRNGRFELLPSPHVAMESIHCSDPSGTLTIDAAGLDGEVRLLPLLVGRIELSSATLLRPALAIDLDGKPMKADSTIGRAVRAVEPSGSQQRLGIVTLVDGTAVFKSRTFSRGARIDRMNLTVDWRDLDSPATLNGSLMVDETAADVAAWIAQPSSLMRGDPSAVALRIQSAPLNLSGNGDLGIAASGASFRGRLSAKSPSLAALAALAGATPTLPAPFANMTLTSDIVIGLDTTRRTSIDLPSLRLHADGNDYEGTLAFLSGQRPSLSGTLATEQLSLAPFVGRLPAASDRDDHWSEAPIVTHPNEAVDLDLRISAGHLRVPPFTVDDAALSIMTRNDRTEVSLVEGKAYGGAIKGRVSVGFADAALNLRAVGSLTEADASALGWDAFGRQLTAGTLSGSASLESTGATPAALMAHLQGWAKGQATDGEISGADLGLGLRELAHKRIAAVVPALRAGRTPFQSLAFDLRLADGIATFGEAEMKGPDSILAVTGNADLSGRTLDLHATASTPASMPSDKQARLPFAVSGPFSKLLVAPDFAAPATPAR